MKQFITVFLFATATSFYLSAVASQPAGYDLPSDTIEIRGKFMTGCALREKIRLAFVNDDDNKWKELSINSNGEFSYRYFMTEPRRVALLTFNGTRFVFFATTNEKVYEMEITCAGGKENFELKNSPENKAYIPFTAASREFQDQLDSLGKLDISKKEVFSEVKKIFNEYHKAIEGIAKSNPDTYTAKVFCAAEKLPDGALDSPEALRKNFLHREAFANPHFYNDFLSQRIIYNYIAIRDKNASMDEPVATLMSIASKNPAAAKKMEDMLFNIFYKSYKDESLVKAFIAWAGSHALQDEVIENRLHRLKKVVAGSPLTDFVLNDTSGAPHRLSETVHSGNLTVLIFFSPTCSHCKERVPQLIPLWEQYKSKGLRIFTVAMEGSPEEWSNFINKNGSREWVNVLEGTEGRQPSDIYYADYTPKFLLIDSQGIIISGMPDLDYLKEEIPKRLE